jgi:type VI secretion system secreted protein VgrG
VFEQNGGVIRTIHGMVAEVEDLLVTEAHHRSYRLVLVPRAHRLTLVETQEVFVNVTVPDVVRQKLKLVALDTADVEMRLTSEYALRELVVEYKETDLSFLSRHAENLGISFFFKHDDTRDTIVFTDHMSGFLTLPEYESVRFRPRGEERDVFAIQYVNRASPKHFFAQDYDYRNPRLDLTGSYTAENGLGGGIVEYGTNFQTPAEAAALAQIRAEEREATHRYFHGESTVAAFTAGLRFQLEGHDRLGDRALLLVEVEHHFSQPVALHLGSGSPASYKNVFRATAAEKTYRPPRLTPRPHISGVEIGVVEPHPSGEVSKHADIDEQGRYTIRFLFDTSPRNRAKSSAPVRMIQPHAGPGYGIHFPLHQGVEVAVVFVDGDPDRPLIQGAVPNPLTSSPVKRANAVQSRIQTSTGTAIIMKDG